MFRIKMFDKNLILVNVFFLCDFEMKKIFGLIFYIINNKCFKFFIRVN